MVAMGIERRLEQTPCHWQRCRPRLATGAGPGPGTDRCAARRSWPRRSRGSCPSRWPGRWVVRGEGRGVSQVQGRRSRWPDRSRRCRSAGRCHRARAARYAFGARAPVDRGADDEPGPRAEAANTRSMTWTCAATRSANAAWSSACWSVRGMSSRSSPNVVTPRAATLASLATQRLQVRLVRVPDGQPGRDAVGKIHATGAGSGPRAPGAAPVPLRHTPDASRGARAGRPWGRRRTCSCPVAPMKSMSSSRCWWVQGRP